MARSLEVRIQVHPRKLSGRSKRALHQSSSYDWILFTSKHAVTFFADTMRRELIPFPKNTKIGVVGSITAQALKAYGRKADVMPNEATAQALARSLGSIKGARILFPRSLVAPYDVIRGLRARGARVLVIPLYTTTVVPLSPAQKRNLLSGAYARIIVRSPSAVQGLKKEFAKREWTLVRQIPCSCIGPTTAAVARTSGFKKVSVSR